VIMELQIILNHTMSVYVEDSTPGNGSSKTPDLVI